MAAARVYVGGLRPDTTERHLEDEFTRYGTIRSIWVARKPPGFAFVEFEDPRDADDCVTRADGQHGWRVELSRRPPGGGRKSDDKPSRGDRYDDRDRGPPRGRELRCYECGDVGHLARDCRSSRRGHSSPRRDRRDYSPRRRGSRSPCRDSRSPDRDRRRDSRSPPPPCRASSADAGRRREASPAAGGAAGGHNDRRDDDRQLEASPGGDANGNHGQEDRQENGGADSPPPQGSRDSRSADREHTPGGSRSPSR